MNDKTQPMAQQQADPQTKSLRDCAVLFAKGFCMGAADVVPGVSGGTMALVLGIYEELLLSVKSFDLRFFRLLAALRIRFAFEKIPVAFLVSLFGGVLCAIFTLAKGLSWLLANHPVGVWSFFFGLVLASAFTVGRRIEKWPPGAIVMLFLSCAAAYVLVGIVPVTTPDSRIFLFICGAIAICAMILPGISGSFILVLLGKYQTVLEAVHRLDFATLIVVGMGAVSGLMLFVRILNWLLNHHHTITLACLTGLMIGSLRKIWPWKTSPIEDSGLSIINVLPTHMNTEFFLACGLALIGIAAVVALQWLASLEE